MRVKALKPGRQLTETHRFALNNIKLTLAHLFWSFDMKLGEGTKDWAVNQKVFNGWVQPALPVLLEKRC